MIWKRIPKEKSGEPTNGRGYTDWKDFLAEEGFFQCVYCAIHENNFGGIRNFHVEHYKPKSDERFKELENELSNLFYACSICNCFKGSHWIEEPDDDFNNCAFPDPSKVDYSNLFSIDIVKGLISPRNKTAEFLIHRLFLNRPQLILERQNYWLSEELDKLIDSIKNSQNQLFDKAMNGSKEALELIKKSDEIILDIMKLLNANGETRPYDTNDIKRK